LATVVVLVALAAAPTSQAPEQPATRDQVTRYVRQRFGIPDTTKITLTDFSPSKYPDFYETTLTVDDGKDKRSELFFVSKNGRYLVDGNIYLLGGDPRKEMIPFARQQFKIPDTVKLTLTDSRETIYPDFNQTTLLADDGKNKTAQPFFVSKSGGYLLDGSIYLLGGEPRKEVIRLISLEDQSDQGPATAPVTLVEYSDLECPICGRLHEMLETEIIPKYGDKLRVVFKEFPLVSVHDWALAAAVAAQCTYQIDPSKYVAFRSQVFHDQGGLNADHIRDMLLHLAAEAGVDNMKLASCMDSQTSLPRVEENLREGQALGVASTPTSFINGRIIVGAPSAADFYKLIDEELHDSK
jgi:protein-disulfide isomerase